MAPVICTGLNQLHVSSKITRKIVYDNDSEFGLGVTNLYHYQGTEIVSTIVQHLQQDSFTGKLLRTSIEAAKIEIGSEHNTFQLPFATSSSFLTDCWIKYVWRYAREQNIHIDDQVTYSLSGNSPDDPFIMDVCVTLGLKKRSLLKFNRCRLYLQIITLKISEPLTHLTSMRPTKLKKQHNFISRILWPVQPRPSQSSIKIWRQALQRIREEYTNIPQHISPSRERIWLWYYDPNLATMYQKSGNTWQKWIRASHRG